MLKDVFKRINNFEKILFLVGIMATFLGFYLINKVYLANSYLSWAFLQSIFLWLMLLLLIILTDSNESIKEELREIIREHVEGNQKGSKIAPGIPAGKRTQDCQVHRVIQIISMNRVRFPGGLSRSGR